MPGLRSRLAALAFAPFVAAALVLLPVIDVYAATPITFGTSDGGGLMVGSSCINGRAAVSVPIHVVWKSASGATKARVDQTTSLGGSWSYCSETKHLRVGDTIKVVAEGTSRTLTVINVSIQSDRTTEFDGRGPVSQDGVVWYNAGIYADYQQSADVTTDSDGRWSVVIEDGLIGGIFAEVDWATPQGDFFIARTFTPFVKVTLGEANVAAGGSSMARTTIKLRDPSDDSLRGKVAVVFDEWGEAQGQFTDRAGDPVSVRVGDRVVSSLAPNLDWHVPDVTGTAKVAKDLVVGVCHETDIAPIWAEVQVTRAGGHGFALADIQSDGSFTADFNGRPAPFFGPIDIHHGDNVTINCYYETGDIVATSFVVP